MKEFGGTVWRMGRWVVWRMIWAGGRAAAMGFIYMSSGLNWNNEADDVVLFAHCFTSGI